MQTAPINLRDVLVQTPYRKPRTTFGSQHDTTPVHFEYKLGIFVIKNCQKLKVDDQNGSILIPKELRWVKKPGIEKITSETFTARPAAKSSWYQIRSGVLLNTGYSIIIHD